MTFAGSVICPIVGAAAGWVAGLAMPGRGFGFAGSAVLGILGAALADWLLPKVGFVMSGGVVAEVANAVIGAVVLLAVVGLLRKKPPRASGSVFMGFRPR